MADTSEAHNKVVRLFTYLEKVLSVDDKVIRDFRATTISPSPWWLASLPKGQDNLFIGSMSIGGQADEEKLNAEGNIILRVKKISLKQPPKLPQDLVEWVEEITPGDEPSCREYIDRKIEFGENPVRNVVFDDYCKDYYAGKQVPEELKGWVDIDAHNKPKLIENRYERDEFITHESLLGLLEGYTQNEWKPWAEEVQESYRVNQLYDQLYALRQLLKTEGDAFELILGQGILAWNLPAVGPIYGPLFNTPLILEFDAINRTIEITCDPMLKSFVDISILQEIGSKSEIDVITWADRINADPFDFNHYESLKSQSQYLANNLSTDAEDTFEEIEISAPPVSHTPSIWNAPVLYVRKRNSDLWSKYAGTIRRDIEQNQTVPNEFIDDLVGNYKDERPSSDDMETNENITLNEEELFFPLPWNEEQKRIAERLEPNYGVVVKGPPGTGKSHTIANLISRFLAQGKTVLVTSQTSKALEVLRDKLPENIQSLAVSQLHQTAKQDQVLQESIAEISSNLGERHTKFSDAKVQAARNELASVRKDKAQLASKIRHYILSDSKQSLEFDGVSIKPMDAARQISDHSSSGAITWFEDKVPYETHLNFTENDLEELHTLALELSSVERALYSLQLPSEDSIPEPQLVTQLFESLADLTTKNNKTKDIVGGSEPLIDASLASEILSLAEDAMSSISSLKKDYELEVFNRCSSSETERQFWFTVLKKLFDATKEIRELENDLLGITVEGAVELPLESIFESIEAIRKKTPQGAKIGGVTKMMLPSNAKLLMNSNRINGSVPDTIEELDILVKYYKIVEIKTHMQALLTQSFAKLTIKPNLDFTINDVVSVEILIRELSRAVLYHKKFDKIEHFCKSHKQLAVFTYTEYSSLETLANYLDHYLAKFELVNLESTLTQWVEVLAAQSRTVKHDILPALIKALKEHDGHGWLTEVEKLTKLRIKKSKADKFYSISQVVELQAPLLYRQCISERFSVPNNLALAWRMAQLKDWLHTIHDGQDIAELQSAHERLSKRELSLNSELVTLLSWQRQIDRVTRRQRDALMMWSLSMKKYGKGTGKYAATHLRAAQQALAEAQAAVPVWIMPLHRVAQMFPNPKAGMFDVVIFDEASQCDIKGITIGYLGKKLLVVGDPEQISPAGVFQNQEKIFELISRFLHDVPHKESFSVTSSFFDLAKIRLSNIVQLNEHFRSVPEIIGFSNHHIYEGKLRPLRYPQPKGQLKPALIPIYVDNGYQNKNNKVNEPEAEQVIQKLVDLLADPEYHLRPNGKPCTFGIISLLGDDQVKYMKSLINDRIDEKTVEERQIICGNAYTFQGDERDVILLSMVKALDPDKTDDTVRALNSEIAKQSFNVAASRARDQMFLFHSIPIDEYRNQEDWRYKLLNWFYHPKTEELNAGRKALASEYESGRASQFSLDVGNLIIDRGYQVMPEYPVIGYRIDLVVQGENSRLAIECDGDQYHTLENWEQDQFREQQLRRAGWEFWRLTGSSFYLNKEKALDNLWVKLDEMGIKPILDSHGTEPRTPSAIQ